MRYDLGRFRRPMRRSAEGQLMSFISLGDGSTLSLDFTAMSSLDSRFTFTRSSTTATFVNSSGLIATAGTDVPRFDYNPTTLAPRGLLIEGSATNLLNWSESFATSGGTNNNWADNNLTRNSTNNTDPANGTTALRVTAASANGTIISTAAIGTSAQRTFSIWLRRVSGTGNIQYTLDNGSTYTTQAITSSWVRYTFASTTAAQRVGIRIVTSGDSIELWGAQLEAGSGASSYIPTGASTVQRAADQMTMANISALSFNQAGGTVFMQIEGNPKDVNTFPYFAAFEQSPSGRGWAFLLLNNSTVSGLRMLGTAFTAGGAGIITSSNHTRPSGKFKFATTLEPSVCRMTYVIAGGSALINTAATGTLATIGSLKFNNTIDTGASDFGSVWISQFKYWPTVLPNTQLQALTS